MTIRSQWIFSETGLQSLTAAGHSIGWLKAWVRSAGADSISVHLLESERWQHEHADWRIIFADESELAGAAIALGLQVGFDQFGRLEIADASSFGLDNPQRTCWVYRNGERLILFIPKGDIAYQRMQYLKHINGGRPLRSLAILPDESGAMKLEPGLSGTLVSGTELPPHNALNCDGVLLEEQVVDQLRKRGLSLRTVESCTAGAIAARIGRVPGASDVLERAWVTYSNDAKSDEVDVPAEMIEKCGAVSREVVSAMAEGGISDGCVCIAVSGVAGPAGGSDEKPVGTVWVAVAMTGENAETQQLQLSGSRNEIQWRTVNAALSMLIERLK
ncbi:amidohydrolase, PncC family [Mariprofundus ferrinatatus]|uniref:Amidohydrolase, PncC family n=1 Tax=Mariprofundus ferrinatatus TaxID=1921087 RepID=A0A2K8LAV0_9PROT|nr:CinA family protein [Mariprofundus ferrinatatus]ATX82064.1 amidohydrolase, PncC family [Mariprofundus ferrinatatus]